MDCAYLHDHTHGPGGHPSLEDRPRHLDVVILQDEPDENKRLMRMYWSLRPKSVENLLEMCGCSGLRPELFSMLACFCGDAALDAADFSNFSRAQVLLWRHVSMAYHEREKLMCIPAVGCKLV